MTGVTGPSVAEPHVAVYIDFDNVVISRYDQVHTHTRDAWRSDNARRHAADEDSDDPIDVRLATARVDVGAILDYAASFGRVSLTRAYADWSVPANAAYRHQLVDRAVDLTQLFPVSGTKNGADIRLSVDAMEDLGKYSDLTHVVLVAGDSDYIALAQRCKQLGRYVVGIGVAGSTSRALIAACDEFSSYDALPGVTPAAEIQAEAQEAAAQEAAVQEGGAAIEKAQAASSTLAEVSRGVASGRIAIETSPPTRKRARKVAAEPSPEELRQRDATNLLVRAIRIAQDRNDEDEWLFGGGVKSQMQRMDAGFKEKPLGYKTFTAFVESRSEVVESRVDPDDGQLRLRLRGR